MFNKLLSPGVRGHSLVGPLAHPRFERHWAFTTSTILMMVSMAISIASAAAKFMADQQQAQAAQANEKARADQQNRIVQANAALANANAINEYKMLQNRASEEGESVALKQHDVAIQTAKATSTAITSAGEGGVGGLGVDQMLRDYAGQEANFRFQSTVNLGYKTDQIKAEMDAAQMTGQGRINAVPQYQQQAVSYPSLMGAGLRMGADVAGDYTDWLKKQPDAPDYKAGSKGSGSATWGSYL